MFHDCTTKGAVCMFYVRMKREAIEQDKLDKMIKESE
jgi:hypothetical protein